MLVQTGGAYGALSGELLNGAARAAAAAAALNRTLSEERVSRRLLEEDGLRVRAEVVALRDTLLTSTKRVAELEAALAGECHKVRCMRDAFAESKGVIRAVVRVRPLLPCDLARVDSPLPIATRWAISEHLAAAAAAAAVAPASSSSSSATQKQGVTTPWLPLPTLVKLLGWWRGDPLELLKRLGVKGGSVVSSLPPHQQHHHHHPSIDLAPSCTPAAVGPTSQTTRQRLILPPELSHHALVHRETAVRLLVREGASFEVDRVFGPSSAQEDVFAEARPFLDCGLRGKGVTLLAYGATGSGKSHTVLGGGLWPTSARLLLDLPGVSASSPPTFVGGCDTGSAAAAAAASLEESESKAPGLLPRALAYVWDALRGEWAASRSDVMEEGEEEEGEGEGKGGGDSFRRGDGVRRELSFSVLEVYNDSVKDLMVEATQVEGGTTTTTTQFSSTRGVSFSAPHSVLSPGKKSGSGKNVPLSIGGGTLGVAGGKKTTPLPFFPPRRSGTSTTFNGTHSANTFLTTDNVLGYTIGETLGDLDGALSALGMALSRRSVASTVLNETSSRSHCVVRMVLRGSRRGTTTTTINIVDLAGMENVRESRAAGGGLVEACAVNTSLSALGEVITGAVKGSPHVPYRSNRLTRILEPSLKGGSRVFLLLTASLIPAHKQDLSHTLKFAARVMGTPLGKVEAEEARASVGALLDGASW